MICTGIVGTIQYWIKWDRFGKQTTNSLMNPADSFGALKTRRFLFDTDFVDRINTENTVCRGTFNRKHVYI